MIISDVIKKLEELKAEHGDLRVRVNADHGQESMACTYIATNYISTAFEAMPEYSDEETDQCGIHVIEMQGY